MKEEFLYILCRTNGYIPQLSMSGPIVHPLKVPKKTVVNMIMSGLTVYEYHAATKMTKELTLDNIDNENRWGDSPIAVANKVETPIVPQESFGVAKPEEPSVEFPLNEDGTVDESKINWRMYSNSQKKKIRAQISEINAAAKAASVIAPVEPVEAVTEEAPVVEAEEPQVSEATVVE